MTIEAHETKITITQIESSRFDSRPAWKWSIDFDGEAFESGDPRATGIREFTQLDHAMQSAADNLRRAQGERNMGRRAANAGGDA